MHCSPSYFEWQPGVHRQPKKSIVRPVFYHNTATHQNIPLLQSPCQHSLPLPAFGFPFSMMLVRGDLCCQASAGSEFGEC